MRFVLLLALTPAGVVWSTPAAASASQVHAQPYSVERLQSSSDDLLRQARMQEVVSILHNTFGYTALGFALGSGVLNPELVESVPTSLHASFGYTASGFAIGALATGAFVHSNALNPSTADESVDFVHAILGIAGGLIVAVTPYLAPGDFHETMGIVGTSVMGVSVLLQLLES